MAALLCAANSGPQTLVASTEQTIIQIKAPTNQRVLVREVRMFGLQAAGGTDKTVKFRMTRSTANFGTSSAVTPVKNNPSNLETIQSTCFATFTVEPTSPTDSGLWWEFNPQSGIIELRPDKSPIEIPGGQSVQFAATSQSSSTPVVLVQVTFEE